MKLSMPMLCSALVLSSALWHGPAFAASQQDKMTACNKAATVKNLTGDARKSFMSECLSAQPATAAQPAVAAPPAATTQPAQQMTQQERMTACNNAASAKNLTGEARKSFMSTCLKGK